MKKEMNRKLIFIINDGGASNYLAGVHVDKENYLNFFESDEGGAWEEHEISLFYNIDKSALHSYFITQRNSQLDYLLLIFCGHGFATIDNTRYFELQTNEAVSISDIKTWVNFTRCLAIFDCCSKFLLEDGGKIPRILTETYWTKSASPRRDKSRQLYNEAILKAPIDCFTAGFAASLNESAGEDSQGGYYSSAIINAAKETINANKNQNSDNLVFSFTYIHNLAAQSVKGKTQNRQNPDFETYRNHQQLPFVVISKD